MMHYLMAFAFAFFATVVIALASELFARIWKEPTTVFEVPAIIPLVPGLGMYKGMNYILQDYVSYGSEVLLGAAVDSCAIALGIMMVSGVLRALKTGNDMARPGPVGDGGAPGSVCDGSGRGKVNITRFRKREKRPVI